MYVLHIYLFYYAQCIVYLFYCMITLCFQTWQDGALVSNAGGGVRQGPLGSVHQGGVGN
jgi:hypothetical protein